MTPLRFGDDPPEARILMAYAARAACGYVRRWIPDDGTAAAARDAGEQLPAPGFVLERIPRADAIRDSVRCDTCATPSEQPGLGL